MAPVHRARDNKLIDALERIEPVEFCGTIWRVVREGRDALTPSAAGGRWDDGTFEVLYTSRAADGAAAEVHYHLSRGQPVFPSRIRHRLYELNLAAKKALVLPDLHAIARLGVDTARYGALSYNERQQEYPRTQEVAETAHFIGFEILVAPNARWSCMNAILFWDRIGPDECEVARDHGPIDWKKWQATPYGY
jgi:RES domain-containing protein